VINGTVREQIQLLVLEGKLSAAAAQQFMNRLQQADGSERARLVRVRITDTRNGRVKAAVTVPVGLFGVGLRLGARLAPAGSVAWPTLVAALAQAGGGRLLEWDDTALQERFELLVE
jgi:hypothetical protein